MIIKRLTDFPAIWKRERLMVGDGRKQCVRHEVKVILVREHIPCEIAAL